MVVVVRAASSLTRFTFVSSRFALALLLSTTLLSTLALSACGTEDEGKDGGADAQVGSPDFAKGSCGNGSVDNGEACDTAIAAGSAGACPEACDDGDSCTADSLEGSGCQLSCRFTPITSCDASAKDGCCPAGCDDQSDADCEAPQACGNGKLDPGELCDTGIVEGAPGACPTVCSDGQACTKEQLQGSGCGVFCETTFVTQCSATADGCCPAGCDASSDVDCSPTCGNGSLEAGESCDTAIAAGQPGACPSATDCDDQVACTTDKLVGSGCNVSCSNTSISACDSSAKDGCCPTGCDAKTDADCSASCGNGVVEAGESCDTAIPVGKAGACPQSCDDKIACTVDTVVGSGCNVACSNAPISSCSGLKQDGCCPTGCNSGSDVDCPASCGNGVLDKGETCDTKIPAGQQGACPTAKSCDDSNACTLDKLVGSGCTVACSNAPISSCSGKAKDGCCPAGCNANSDADCSATCGNGVVELGETCDTKIPAGQQGACPLSCDDGAACTLDKLVGSGCNVSCSNTPISACGGKAKDGCCPAGCNANSDADCSASCGNGVLEAGESCDTKIPAGQTGACPTAADCDDSIACTADKLVGSGCSAACSNTAISACIGGAKDGCCPVGCNANSDADCSASCGNGVLEQGETCDTKIPAGQTGACPQSCDDSKPCTTDTLVGSGCTVACSFTPIASCSGASSDGCCPTGCNANSDVDCKPACGNGALEQGELCDTKIPAGQKGACPTSCDDQQVCTTDTLTGTGCQQRCNFSTITKCVSNDGCCPKGCNANSDSDCAAICGNGVLESGELCDTAISAGQKGACPTQCRDGVACTSDLLLGKGCQQRCSFPPISQCLATAADGCCPKGCTSLNDVDCKPACGNGALEQGELCDTAIPAGQQGACPTVQSCEDGDPCSLETVSGSGCQQRCAPQWITSCGPQIADKCCPKGCNAITDLDCKAVCGNGVLEPGEKCDTKIPVGVFGTCPTSCNDGKVCTSDTLSGSGCQAECVYTPRTCSLKADKCCPKGCTSLNDADCSPTTLPCAQRPCSLKADQCCPKGCTAKNDPDCFI
jgi:hypothetical protein